MWLRLYSLHGHSDLSLAARPRMSQPQLAEVFGGPSAAFDLAAACSIVGALLLLLLWRERLPLTAGMDISTGRSTETKISSVRTPTISTTRPQV